MKNQRKTQCDHGNGHAGQVQSEVKRAGQNEKNTSCNENVKPLESPDQWASQQGPDDKCQVYADIVELLIYFVLIRTVFQAQKGVANVRENQVEESQVEKGVNTRQIVPEALEKNTFSFSVGTFISVLINSRNNCKGSIYPFVETNWKNSKIGVEEFD